MTLFAKVAGFVAYCSIFARICLARFRWTRRLRSATLVYKTVFTAPIYLLEILLSIEKSLREMERPAQLKLPRLYSRSTARQRERVGRKARPRLSLIVRNRPLLHDR